MMFIGVQNTFAIEELVFNEEGRFIVPFEDLVADGDFTFDAETGELDGRGSEGRLYIKLPEGGLDMSEVARIKVTVIKEEGWDDPIFGLRIFNQGVMLNANPWQGSKYNLDFTTVAAKATAVDCIEWISGDENQRKAGYVTIESIVFEKDMTPDQNALTIDMMKQWDGTGADAVVIGEAVKNKAYNLNKVLGDAQLVFGGYDMNEYVNLSDYASMKLTCNAGTVLRFFFNNQGETKSTYEIKKTAGSDGIITIDLQDARFKEDGFAHLIGIKTYGKDIEHKVKKIQIYEAVKNALTSDMFMTWDGVGADAQPTGKANCNYNLNTQVGAGALIYGDTQKLKYADLTEYAILRAEYTPGKTLRFLFNDMGDGALEIKKVAPEGGVVEIQLHADELADQTFVHLLGIKVPYGSGKDLTVTKLQIFKADEITAIHKLEVNEAKNSTRYNLAGQKVDPSYKGIVIVGGKKIIQ